MYDFIRGTVAERTATAVIVDAAGVGFELLAPLGAAFPAPGEEALVWAHLVVREDAQTLYGFGQRDQRELFRVLLKVRGVGPAMALGILSGLAPEELAAAVTAEDLGAFTKVKGVGKKTAQQILLDLRDKGVLLMELAGGRTAAAAAAAAEEAPAASSHEADAVLALVSIGYSEKEATKLVEAAAEAVGTDDLEALVRAAMRG